MFARFDTAIHVKRKSRQMPSIGRLPRNAITDFLTKERLSSCCIALAVACTLPGPRQRIVLRRSRKTALLRQCGETAWLSNMRVAMKATSIHHLLHGTTDAPQAPSAAGADMPQHITRARCES